MLINDDELTTDKDKFIKPDIYGTLRNVLSVVNEIARQQWFVRDPTNTVRGLPNKYSV